MQDFNWDRYYGRGEELYGQMARNEPVLDPEGVSMFGKEGQHSEEYLSALKSKGIRMDTRSIGGMTPRDAHFQRELTKLGTGMSAGDRATSLGIEMMYGQKPRYERSDEGGHSLKSPYALEKDYRAKTKGMDPFERMDYDAEFRSLIKSLPTDTSNVDDKAFNAMKKSSY
jgi:hypothetical protein